MQTTGPYDIDEYYESSPQLGCRPCFLMVNDMALFQCTECRTIFSLKRHKRTISLFLRDRYGDEFWEKEYEKLKKIKSLVNRKRFDQLNKISYTGNNKSGIIKSIRYFYEQKL